MKPHITFAHDLWQNHLLQTDTAIDATAGNGHDALFLYKHLQKGKLIAIDIQEAAIKKAESLVASETSQCKLGFILGSHATFPASIEPESVKLIVYNLGYLPGGDKQITTLTASTLLSLQNALPLIQPGGMISVTLYPGHLEGAKEAEEVLAYAKTLSINWNVEHKVWGKAHSPSLLLMKKKLL